MKMTKICLTGLLIMILCNMPILEAEGHRNANISWTSRLITAGKGVSLVTVALGLGGTAVGGYQWLVQHNKSRLFLMSAVVTALGVSGAVLFGWLGKKLTSKPVQPLEQPPVPQQVQQPIPEPQPIQESEPQPIPELQPIPESQPIPEPQPQPVQQPQQNINNNMSNTNQPNQSPSLSTQEKNYDQKQYDQELRKNWNIQYVDDHIIIKYDGALRTDQNCLKSIQDAIDKSCGQAVYFSDSKDLDKRQQDIRLFSECGCVRDRRGAFENKTVQGIIDQHVSDITYLGIASGNLLPDLRILTKIIENGIKIKQIYIIEPKYFDSITPEIVDSKNTKQDKYPDDIYRLVQFIKLLSEFHGQALTLTVYPSAWAYAQACEKDKKIRAHVATIIDFDSPLMEYTSCHDKRESYSLQKGDENLLFVSNDKKDIYINTYGKSFNLGVAIFAQVIKKHCMWESGIVYQLYKTELENIGKYIPRNVIKTNKLDVLEVLLDNFGNIILDKQDDMREFGLAWQQYSEVQFTLLKYAIYIGNLAAVQILLKYATTESFVPKQPRKNDPKNTAPWVDFFKNATPFDIAQFFVEYDDPNREKTKLSKKTFLHESHYSQLETSKKIFDLVKKKMDELKISQKN
jgi:hypothetical protein